MRLDSLVLRVRLASLVLRVRLVSLVLRVCWRVAWPVLRRARWRLLGGALLRVPGAVLRG